MGNPHGVQWIVELYGCRAELLERVPYVEQALAISAERARASVIRNNYHQFEPYGVSGVTILQQSHVTIHTWPEDTYAAVDFFFCHEDMDVEAAIAELKRCFQPTRVAIDRFARGPHQNRASVIELDGPAHGNAVPDPEQPTAETPDPHRSLQPDEPA
jgi:S-adenosylmethionine decarboxylase proenzyme